MMAAKQQKGKGNTCASFKKPEKCAEDDHPLALFCITCNVPICMICQASKRHSGHSISSAKDVGAEQRLKLQNSLEEVITTTASILIESENLWKVTMQETKSSVDAAPAIEAHFDALFEALRRRKKVLLDKVKLIKRETEVKVAAAREAITTCQSQSVALQESTRLALLQPDLALVANSPSLNKSILTFQEDVAKILSEPSEFVGTPVYFPDTLLQDITEHGFVGALAIPQLTFTRTNSNNYNSFNCTLQWTVKEAKVGFTFELQISSKRDEVKYGKQPDNWTVRYTGKDLNYNVPNLPVSALKHSARVRCGINNQWSGFSPVLALN